MPTIRKHFIKRLGDLEKEGFEAFIEHSDPWTYVRAKQRTRIPGQKNSVIIEGTGMARRASFDAPNPQVGEDLAMDRARAEIRRKRNELKNRSR